MRLVVGTRRWLGPEWTHCDIDPRPLVDVDGNQHPVDVVGDARSVPLPDGAVDHLYSQECLEHFPWRETAAVVGEWCRLVKRGGTIRIEVPDFLMACQQVLTTDTEEMDFAIQQIIFGGEENQWDFHYTGLTPRTLSRHLENCGMTVNEVKRGDEVGYLRVDASRD